MVPRTGGTGRRSGHSSAGEKRLLLSKKAARRSAKIRIVYVITTGGTIERAYCNRTGNVQNFDTKIQLHLAHLRLPACHVNIVPLMNIDSLEMSGQDRVLILGMVRAILKEMTPIIITHGTDTMVETGLYLERALPQLLVPIVLTGAMKPLGFEGSDGLQNLTESLLAVQLVPAGIFVVMHNEVFPIRRVRKDKALGRFVWTE